MKIFGFYPFTVHVANMFDPALEAALEVKHYQHRTYFTKQPQGNKEGIIISEITHLAQSNGSDETNLSINPVTIPGGHSIVFPMQFGDERVEIFLRNPPTIDYSYIISVGTKALCRGYYFSIPYDETTSLDESYLLENAAGVVFTPSCFEELETFEAELGKLEEKGEVGFHVGGAWEIPASFNYYGWMLEIRKYNFDPEDVSVPIGTQTPG